MQMERLQTRYLLNLFQRTLGVVDTELCVGSAADGVDGAGRVVQVASDH